MTPQISPFAQRNPEALQLTGELPSLQANAGAYRAHMRKIGEHLATGVLESLPASSHSDICVVCTAEDADFLAGGVINALENAGLGDRVRLICLWNDRIRDEGLSIAPIVKEYCEDFDADGPTVIVVKSIIAGGCVVKTNLLRVLSTARPGRIYIAAPVMLDGAEAQLRGEFPQAISDNFEFVHFATHFDKDGANVVPGIGGSVYELLGLGDQSTKNKYMPEIVRERRRKAFPAFA